jgi:MFS transporter, putative metabolite:H+ symporter
MSEVIECTTATHETVETYVSRVMDNAPLTATHYKIFGLISAGYFFDIANMAVFGSLVPMMLRTNFLSSGQVAIVGSATLFGLAVGCAGQGEFTDRFGRKAVYQFNLLLFGLSTLASAFAPDYLWLAAFRFLAGVGLGAEQPLCFAYAGEYAPMRNRGRILSGIHLIGGAFSWPLTTLFTLSFIDIIGWRGIFATLAIGALIVFVLRFSLPESPRWLATHGRGVEALGILKRMGLCADRPERFLADEVRPEGSRDPLLIVFLNYPFRLFAGTVCFIAFFGGAVGLSTWLPNMMATVHGMSIAKSLTYSLGMMLAFPCASAFMMFAIEKFGRKRLSVSSFFMAAVFAFFFMRTTTDAALLAVGFFMIFFIQLAGNSMQILISEVFPTSARATGFGIASGAGRLGTAFVIPGILWVQNGWGVGAVFMVVAASLMLAASFVPLLGPEAKGRALDELAPSPK